jgi:hypothetical protein
MIKEKRMTSNGTALLTPKIPSLNSSELFNKNRNDSRYLVYALNAEQKVIYNKLMRDKKAD